MESLRSLANSYKNSFRSAILLSLGMTMSLFCLGFAPVASADSTTTLVAQDGTGHIYSSVNEAQATVIKSLVGAGSPVMSAFPTLALNNSKIFFVTPISGKTPAALHSMNLNGSDGKTVSTLPDQNSVFAMQWSQPAQKFVITDASSQAYTINAQGGDYTKVFGGVAYQADWAQDGKHIGIEAKSGVYIMNTDGSNSYRIIGSDVCQTSTGNTATWASSAILFIGCTNPNNVSEKYSIQEYYITDKSLTTTVQSKSSSFGYLAASPNGSKLAYETTGPIGKSSYGESIYDLSLVQTSMQKPVPKLVYAVAQGGQSENLPAPIIAWAPDNSKFSFTGPNNLNPAIHLATEEGNSVHEILDTKSASNPIVSLEW